MPDLKRGSTGAAVKELQTFLGVEPVNGNFGPATEAALKSWQEKNGLAQTGIATNKELIALAQENSDKVAQIEAERINNATAPTNSLNTDYGTLALQKAGDYEAEQRFLANLRLENYDATASLVNQPIDRTGTFESGIYDVDSLAAAQISQAQPPIVGQAAVVQPNTTNISNTQNTQNTANNTTNTLNQQIQQPTQNTTTAVSNVQNNQSTVVQQLQNTGQLVNTQPTIETGTFKSGIYDVDSLTAAQISQAQPSIVGQATVQPNTPNINTTTDQPARVESSQLISKSETSQIINPPNQVVGALENVGSSLTQSIQTMNSDLSTNISTMKSGDTVANSQVTQVDQSSIYNNTGNTASQPQVGLKEEKAETVSNSNNMNDIYLSAIYEALTNGIKVKIST